LVPLRKWVALCQQQQQLTARRIIQKSLDKRESTIDNIDHEALHFLVVQT